jgi:predicted transcriptional regulator
MPLKKYISRINYLDALIRSKATGTPRQLAQKMNLSERAVRQYVSTLKDLGCPIKFCRKRNSYYYECEGKVVISFFDSITEKLSGGGGNTFRIIFLVKKLNGKNIAVSVYNLALCFKTKTTLALQNGSKLQHQFKQYSKALYNAA